MNPYQHTKKNYPQNALPTDFFNIDFKARYFDLLNNNLSYKKESAIWQNALEEIEDIYNNSPCGFHSLDERGFFVRMNNTELRWLGYTREELIGKKRMEDILTSQSLLVFRKNFPIFKRTGVVNELEFDFVRKDGSTLSVLLSATAVYDTRGNFKMSRSFLFNITSRKMLEQQLQKKNDELNDANEKLFSLNQDKDRFIGIASHDLKNPLVSIKLLSGLLTEGHFAKDEQKLKDVYQNIHEASLQMYDLITNYLNVNRIETGALVLNITTVNITRLIKQIVSRYGEFALRKHIVIYFPNSEDCYLNTDQECFSQIVENLISNAIKYTPSGKSVQVNIKPTDNDVKIEIDDEGVGIKKEEMPLLFKKFQKLSSQPTGGEISTGLGLYITKYLTDQLNGTIKVKSKPKGGTKFTVCFENSFEKKISSQQPVQ